MNSCVTASKLLSRSQDMQQDAPVIWLMSTWETEIKDQLPEKSHVQPVLFYIDLCVYLWNTAFTNMNFKLDLTNFRDSIINCIIITYKVSGKHISQLIWYMNSIVGLIADIFQ